MTSSVARSRPPAGAGPRRANLVLDCDGVILDFVAGFDAYASALGHSAAIPFDDVRDFDLRDLYPHVLPARLKAMFAEYAAHHSFADVPFMPGARDAIRRLRRELPGLDVVVVTSCGDSATTRLNRMANLEGLGLSDVAFRPFGGSKADVLARFGRGTPSSTTSRRTWTTPNARDWSRSCSATRTTPSSSTATNCATGRTPRTSSSGRWPVPASWTSPRVADVRDAPRAGRTSASRVLSSGMRIAVPEHLPLGVELFAGCGGLSTGFMDAGLSVAAGFEAEPRAVRAYAYNHAYRGGAAVAADVTALTPERVRAAVGGRRVDFVLGGPPCQPFSHVGKRMGLLDPRADCVWAFARLAIALGPTVALMENVPAILDHDVVPRLEGMFRDAGYRVGHALLDAASFGVPQWRERLFLVAMRDVADVRFPDPTHGHDAMPLFGVAGAPFPTVRDAIGDLPDAADFGKCSIHNHEPPSHAPRTVETFVGLRPGDRDPASKHVRLRPDAPSVTLRAGSGTFMPLRPVHPVYDRVVTVRESARLHGYSDDFVWPDDVPRLHQYRQVGNSVPPALGAALAREIARSAGWATSAPSLAGDPASRASAVTMTDEERRALRLRRSRIGAAA